MTAYLYPRARAVEILTAMYSVGLGLFVGLTHAFTGNPPMAWTRMSEYGQICMAMLFVVAGIVHGSGIRLNGNWPRVSSSMRLIGMGSHACLIAVLVVLGINSTAGYTYVWVLVLLLFGCANAARDTIHAWRYEVARWKTY